MSRYFLSFSSALFFFLLAFTISCAKSGGSGSKISVNGRLSSQFNVARITPFDRVWAFLAESISFAGGISVNQIWAIPTANGNLDESLFASYQRFTPNSDGTFSLSLSTGNDWLLLLLNTSAADKASQVVAYLTMTSPDGNTLHNIPISKATASVDMGTVSQNGDETSTSKSTTDNLQSFSLTQAELISLAKSDRMLRQVKNVYRNFDAGSGTYTRVRPYFSWYKADSSQLVNAFSDPAVTVASDFSGYLYYFHTNHSEIDPTRMCNAADTLALYPPASVSNVSSVQGATPGTWSPSSPLSNQGGGGGGGTASSGCGVGQLYFRDDTGKFAGSGPSYQFNYIAGNSSLNPPIPAGDWTVKVNATAIVSFDGQLGTPFKDDATPTLPIVYIPSTKLDVTGGNLTGVEVKWYQRNDDGSFSQVTDAAILGRLSNVMVEIADYSGGGSGVTELGNLSAAAGFTYTPTQSWAYPHLGGSGAHQAQSTAVSYDFNGISLRFDYRKY